MSKNLREHGPIEISRFRQIVIAGLRAKQLSRGSKPRLTLDAGSHKNTSIAMEEVRQGLITFTYLGGRHLQVPGVAAGVDAGLTESSPLMELEHNSF